MAIVAAFLFSGALIYSHNDKYVELIVAVFGTFVAAWVRVGPSNAEQKTRHGAERNARISAANKTSASSARVLSPLNAAITTFALNAAVWFLLGLLIALLLVRRYLRQ